MVVVCSLRYGSGYEVPRPHRYKRMLTRQQQGDSGDPDDHLLQVTTAQTDSRQTKKILRNLRSILSIFNTKQFFVTI